MIVTIKSANNTIAIIFIVFLLPICSTPDGDRHHVAIGALGVNVLPRKTDIVAGRAEDLELKADPAVFGAPGARVGAAGGVDRQVVPFGGIVCPDSAAVGHGGSGGFAAQQSGQLGR